MKKSQRFSTIAALAKNKEQTAAVALGASNRNYAEHVNKLASLKQYRDDYVKQFTENGKQGMDVKSMQTYKKFIEGLEQAIREQQARILEAEQHCKQSTKQWQHTHTKTEIMNTTVNRFKKQEQVDDAHQEQKESDDRVSSCHNKVE